MVQILLFSFFWGLLFDLGQGLGLGLGPGLDNMCIIVCFEVLVILSQHKSSILKVYIALFNSFRPKVLCLYLTIHKIQGLTLATEGLVFALISSFLNRLLKHPAKEYYQCTTIHFFENLSETVDVGNSTELRLYGWVLSNQRPVFRSRDLF